MTKCPFSHDECGDFCSLYIKPDDMSETMRNKLASIGVVSREKGYCSFKIMALASGRSIFENTKTNMSSR